jgi:hypothetical protein
MYSNGDGPQQDSKHVEENLSMFSNIEIGFISYETQSAQISVLCNVTTHSFVEKYQHLVETCCTTSQKILI